jgi:hypothetical protein
MKLGNRIWLYLTPNFDIGYTDFRGRPWLGDAPGRCYYMGHLVIAIR